MNFIYPGNLKETKTFMNLSIVELAVSAILLMVFIAYSVQNRSLIPLCFPISFIILNVRILDNGSNLWEQIVKIFDYLLNSQQTFFWGERK